MTVATDHRGRPVSRRRRAVLEGGDLAPLEVLIDDLGSRPVVVIGSAPIEGVLRWTKGTAVVTVNGSLSSIRERVPDVHLMNARVGPHVTWNKERRALNAAMFAQSADRHVRTLALLPVTEVGAEEATLERLRRQGTTWDRVMSITKATKVLLAHNVGALDRERDRHLSVSAGMFGVLLALWAGASSVRTEGFSFDAGYAYLAPELVPENSRGHLRGDKTAIVNIREKFGPRVMGDLFTRRTQQTPRRT